jgi:hypothetical protein
MTVHTERLCDGIAGRRPIPWAAASLGREFVDTDPAPGTVPVALEDGVIPRLTACDQCARAVWQVRSTHRTSAGAVGYARCPCGAWLVLLDGRPLATARPRSRAPTHLATVNVEPGACRGACPHRIVARPNGGPS